MFSSLRIPISPIFCSFNLRLKNDFYGYRVNSDELAKELGNYESSYIQNKAGKLAIAMRNKFLNSGASFNIETTLSGKGIVKFIKLAKSKVNIKENKMQNTYLDRVGEALTLLNRLDNFKPPTNGNGKNVKSYSIKLFILLFTIAKHEGETQAFYSELLDWTTANTSIHTGYLYDNGFISKAYDDRDMRNLARRLFITPKGREFIESLLRKERS